MDTKTCMYSKALQDVIKFCELNGSDNWLKYFITAKLLFENNKMEESARHVIGAYGGMCSWNDYDGVDRFPDLRYDYVRTQLYDAASSMY